MRLHDADPVKDPAVENTRIFQWRTNGRRESQQKNGKELGVQNEAKQIGMDLSIVEVTLRSAQYRRQQVGANRAEWISVAKTRSFGKL